MAKTKAPLFSFDARGQLAEALVYGRWKGLQTIRQYVVPADPETAGQVTQRGHFGGAVALYQGTPWDQPIDVGAPGNTPADDSRALARTARLQPRPMSGYNWVVKQLADSLRRGDAKTDMFSNHCVLQSSTDNFILQSQTDENLGLANLRLRWGYRPTFLPNIKSVVEAIGPTGPRTKCWAHDVIVPGTPVGTEIFARFEYHDAGTLLYPGPICRFFLGQGNQTAPV